MFAQRKGAESSTPKVQRLIPRKECWPNQLATFCPPIRTVAKKNHLREPAFAVMLPA
jgi:hypothetical protein